VTFTRRVPSASTGLADRYDPGAGGRGSLSAVWADHFRQRPEAPALEDAQGRLRYADLDHASRRVAGRLHRAGLESGERVVLSAASSLAYAIAHVACLRLGLVVIPTNTAYGQAELAHVVGDARPRAAIVDDPERERALRRMDPALLVVAPEVELPDGDPPKLDGSKPGDPALIGYTSGTTGRPKGAVLSHGNLTASLESLRLAWQWVPDDRLVLTLPLFHMHGLGVGLHGTLHVGASAILLPGFSVDAVLDAVTQRDATLFFGVPTLYHRLVESERAPLLRSLRLCVSGSAPLPAELHGRFEALTGQRILERYGMTETAMLVSNPVTGERRPGTVGLPLPGVELRLEGQPPEIQVRGPNVFSGYWERPEANAASFTPDGWFRTGDLGELDEAGYLRISGRAKELVISGGMNVYPREVEDALRAHPGIEDAAVVGSPSEEWGELVTAYVVGSSVPELEALRGFLEGTLATFKHPRALHVVSELPRNALGKVQKHRLAEGRVLPES